MDQTFLNIIFGGVMGAFGWFLRILWEADHELRADLSRLREELPKEYVSKDDIERRFDRIDKALDKIWTALQEKADK